ncbi:PAS domain-containing protein [Acidicapsa dinghuensis]|uniref:histidine kinase n=1 Tax=Acidicapsa dinghuensis TaxID=2218256 RepID=A0ABW1EEL8_9BACT|nr:PAS domain-containing protein [Acidicapsa dinghuensis]
MRLLGSSENLPRTSMRHHVLALIWVALATGASLAFSPYLPEYPAVPACFYLCAVTASAIYGDFQSSITALVLSDILLGLLFWRRFVYTHGVSLMVREFLYTALSGYVCLLAHKLKLARAGEARSIRAFADFTHSAPIGFSLHRPDTSYIDINPQLAEWNEMRREEHLGRTLAEAVPGLAASLIPHLKRVLETGESTTVEIAGDPHEANNKQRYWLTSYFPVRNARGKIEAVGTAVLETTRERHAQAALANSESRYRLLTETLSQYIWTADENGKIDYCNKYFLEFCGMTLEEVKAGKALELFHPEDRERMLTKISASLASGKIFEDEHRVRHARDEEYHWHLAHLEPFFDLSGARRWLGVAIDVTARKKAEIELRAAHDRLSVLLSSISESFIVLDKDWRFQYANDSVMEHRGMAWSEMQGKSVWEIYPAALETEFKAGYEKVMRERTPHRFEVKYPMGDGTTRYFLVHAHPTGEGLSALVTNITDRKGVEEQARLAHERFQLALHGTPVSVFHQDRDLRYIWVYNPARGMDPNEMLGKRDRDFIERASDAEMTETIKREVIRTGVGQRREIVVRSRGADEIYDLQVEPLRDADGDITGVSCAAIDITERKRTQEALIRSEKLASAGRLAASIAHEINNPLEAVTNLLYLTRHVPNLPEEAQQYISMASEELERVAHITRQSLGFYREPSTAQITSLAAVMQSAIELFRGKLRKQQVAIRQEWKDDIAIEAVGGELRQVFCNLLSNSIEAMKHGGNIRIRMGQSRVLEDAKQYVRITFADDGCGVPQEIRTQIFEPFFTTRSSTGTGLGLWVSKQLVEKHGGRIRLRSNTGTAEHGTAVMILLPVSECGSQNQLKV